MDFFAEFGALLRSKPVPATTVRASGNCMFGDFIMRSKNVYLGYFMDECEDCYYSDSLARCRDCVDCLWLTDSELCYECVDGKELYACSLLENCRRCSHCDFCLDCRDCKDCFGCFGLKHQQFRIFNKPYGESEYRQKVSELKNFPPQKIWDTLAEPFRKHPRLFRKSSAGCRHCFDANGASNSLYLSDILDGQGVSSDCLDCDFSTNIVSCYDCHAAEGCSNCRFIDRSAFCEDSEYLRLCYRCRNCFGCISLVNKEYCILNRQFTRDEYFVAVEKIKSELRERSEYGKPLADLLFP